MSRKPNLVDNYVLEALKDQVKARINLECKTYADIQLLQQEIRKSMNEYLSLQTLNRLFGLIRNDFYPSQHTLDVLSQYLQYSTFHEFTLLNDTVQPVKRQVSFESKFIFSVFSSVNPSQGEGKALQTVIRNILNIINDDYQMASGIYQSMASISFGRKYFFEQHINMDGLGKHYGDGLIYYLLYAQNRQDQFFAYNLYCLRFFLTADHKSFARYFTLIKGFSREEIQGFQPLHIGLYHAIRILNQSIEDKRAGKPTTVMNWYDDEILPTGNTTEVYRAWYQVIEALVLTGKFEKAWQHLNNHLPPDVLINSDDDDFITQINMLHLISGFCSGHIDLHQARQLFSELNARTLNTLVQNYFSILLMLLKKRLFAKAMGRNETNTLIDRLIKKTGFVYFFDYELQLQKSVRIF